MTFLGLLLVFKIGVTLIMASIPMLMLPGERLMATLKIGAEALPLARLYGVAITALLVGYASGFAPAAAGIFPWGVVIMGIVSNGGVTITLVITGAWRRAVPAVAVFGSIAVALIGCALAPGAALVRAF